jgi:large subunit ribosomal protein L19
MTKIPKIKPGDLVRVYTKIKEGDKERIAPYQGVVIQIRGNAPNKMLTVRKISAGVGIERIFPISSPLIAKIEVKKKGKVRRAKLNYLRERKGKKMKIREVAAPAKKIQKDVSAPEKEKPEKTESITPDEQKTTAQPEDKTGESAAGPKSVEKA